MFPANYPNLPISLPADVETTTCLAINRHGDDSEIKLVPCKLPKPAHQSACRCRDNYMPGHQLTRWWLWNQTCSLQITETCPSVCLQMSGQLHAWPSTDTVMTLKSNLFPANNPNLPISLPTDVETTTYINRHDDDSEIKIVSSTFSWLSIIWCEDQTMLFYLAFDVSWYLMG